MESVVSKIEREKGNDENATEKQPVILYHGTAVESLEHLEPRDSRTRSNEEGLVVFATPDRAFATMFMSPRPDDSWAEKGSFNGVYYIVIGDERRFRENDRGGEILAFSSEGFDYDEDRGMGRHEWTSRGTVYPESAVRYASTLDAMIESGVQVYFVDGVTLERIRNANDHGLGILRELVSENQRRGQNVRSLENEIDS